MIETLTINEAAAYLRQNGLSISSESLATGLEKGVFPFGCAYRVANSNGRCVYIFKKLLDKWINERAVYNIEEAPA